MHNFNSPCIVNIKLHFLQGSVVVVIPWWLDLKLSMQSVPITTKVVSSNSAHGKVYLIQHYVIKFVVKSGNLSFICDSPIISKTVEHIDQLDNSVWRKLF